MKAIWGVRKAGLGLLLGMKGDKKPIAFVEDTAVAPAKLPEFIKRFREVVARHDTIAGYYGHCSVGCMHIRPLINLKQESEMHKMVSIANAISDLVLEFNGAMSGEHGDGLARSHFNAKLFGPALYDAFRQVKRAFDPTNLMNPGKIVDAPAMTESLKISPRYETWEPRTTLDFSAQGGFAAAIEMCSGMGECRKKLDGTMCPSYMGTLDEEHSTRGRANALRNVISGRVPQQEFTGKRLYEVMDLCLECKACKAECPSNVDMAKLKYEFLDHYHRANGLAAAQQAVRRHRDVESCRLQASAHLQLGCRFGAESLADGSVYRHRSAPAAAAIRRRNFRRLVSQAQDGRRRLERRRGVVSRHFQQFQFAQCRHCRDAFSGKVRLSSFARR